MSTEFPTQLAILSASEGSDIDLAQIQTEVLRQAMERLREESSMQKDLIRQLITEQKDLNVNFDRRTAQWTPAKAYAFDVGCSNRPERQVIARRIEFEEPGDNHGAQSSPPSLLGPSLFVDEATRNAENTGMYQADDDSLRGFIVPSPSAKHVARPRTQIDLVLPAIIAFCAPGMFLLSHIGLSFIFKQVMFYHPVTLYLGRELLIGQLYFRRSSSLDFYGMCGSHQIVSIK